jgi:hypothetical protein
MINLFSKKNPLFTRCDKVLPGLGATNLLLLLLPVTEFWSFYTQFSILLVFWQPFGNFLSTFCQFFVIFLTTFWQLFDNFLGNFFDNFWQSWHFIFLYLTTLIVATGLRTIQLVLVTRCNVVGTGSCTYNSSSSTFSSYYSYLACFKNVLSQLANFYYLDRFAAPKDKHCKKKSKKITDFTYLQKYIIFKI